MPAETSAWSNKQQMPVDNPEPSISLTPEHLSPKKNRTFRVIYDVLETIVLAALLFFGINAVSSRIRVDGSSMEPTLYNNEFVLVNKLAYKLGAPRRGDIVVFYLPRQVKREYIKRIIGLPGDRIEVRDRQVFVNGESINEPYTAATPVYMGNWTVPDDAVFVLGDNRNNSTDSHTWGAISLENVIGKAVWVYWPPLRWGILEQVSLGESTEP